jgi:flavin-dependent dehydrogenase
VAKEFSYTTTRHAGDGWVLVGDDFGFLDPIYSTGVFLALRSGELAADDIVAGLKSGDLSARQLSRWTADFKRGVSLFRKLVDAFYTVEFSFAKFLKEHPEHHRNLTDPLIGRAFYDGAGRIFDDLEPALEAARTTSMSRRV